jgi:hypothetical protein
MSTPPNETDSMQLMMLNMQQQQIKMQEQMNVLMNRSISQQQTDTQQRRRVKLERLSIESDSSDNTWIIFTDAWARYKTATDLVDLKDIRNELRAVCSPSVNEMLFNFIGPDALNIATEDQLLNHIKSVAVKSIHREVYRQQFFATKQSDGETTLSFISRLKSQAMLCDFQLQNVNYSEDMIRTQAITGLYNASHQNRILSEVSEIDTLNQLIQRLLILESTTKASSHFQPEGASSMITPVKSQYQKLKFVSKRPPTKNKEQVPRSNQCFFCGRQRHPEGRKKCPAQGQTCHKCGKLNHLAIVCQSSSSNAIYIDKTDEEDEHVSFLSSISSPPL